MTHDDDDDPTPGVEAAVAQERARCISVIAYAYSLMGGERLGTLPLALELCRQGRSLSISRGILDVSAQATMPASPALNSDAEWKRKWLAAQPSAGNA